jgi:hypothetical protein
MRPSHTVESYIGPKTIRLTRRAIPSVVAYYETKIEEPFTYVDAGMYNEEGTFVDAGLYNTTVWTDTWNGGYA